MTTPTPDTDPNAPLRQALFTDKEIDALNALWANDAIDRVLNAVPSEVRRTGGTAADAFDAVQHGLNYGDVISILAHGFTAHQVHVLLRDPNACRILEPMTEEDRDTHFFERHTTPRQVIVNVLRIAHHRREAKTFLNLYTRALNKPVKTDTGYQTANELATSWAGVATLLGPEPPCGCRR